MPDIPHTPTPWYYKPNPKASQSIITDGRVVIAGIPNELYQEDQVLADGNAAFIVMSANSHGRLLEAAVGILSEIPELWGDLVKDGKLTVTLSADAVSGLESALTKVGDNSNKEVEERRQCAKEMLEASRKQRERFTKDLGYWPPKE